MSEVKIAPIPDLGQRTDEITIYAGPCSVESAEQFEEVAECVADLGLHWIRGGAFKPRTNPHSFQGLGEEALKIMKAAGDTYNLKTLTEVMDSAHCQLVSDYVDGLQVGARNFQNFSLLQQRTVLRNVMFPLELRHADKKEAEKRARELLELVGLADKCNKYPSQLSGGQQQRVAIARALVNNPSIMLCDEATSALDSMTTHSILKLLKDINEEMGVTIVLITHSLAVAELICDNVVVIDEGKIVEEGKTEDIFANPQSDVARKLLEKRL